MQIDPLKIKALAIDLDGTTLLPNAVLGERTRLCIRQLISRGKQIIISTGRAIEASERFRSAMGAEGPMVFFNGAEVVNVPDGEVLHTNLINLDVVDYGVDIARELNVHYQVYLQAGLSPETGKPDPKQKWEALLIDKYDTLGRTRLDIDYAGGHSASPVCGKEAEYYYNHTGIKPVVADLKKIAALPIPGCIKGMYIADPSIHDEIRMRMYNRFGDNIQVLRSYPTFLEVINKGVSKGEGLKAAMLHRGLKPEEVIAFGDEENDVSMFSVAGYSAAPENARKNIKEAADVIYGSNEEEGLSEFLEKMFL